ncbi:MAG: four helix bundle protein [Saprospiraceae bacterium]|jgi:four helix bundle protein|nr:four helix bundle protein [Saprospiraceae bacterium]MBK8827123.1 four helix bundle protein [Saprospiraceae bacterium]
MNIYGFEKLDVWQKSRLLVRDIYLITKSFPEDERFGLTSQLRRAMISVSCNIAEGTSRWSNKEKIRFIEIAYGSLMEVVNCLMLAFDLEYISEQKILELRFNIDIVANKLNGLKKSLDRSFE